MFDHSDAPGETLDLLRRNYSGFPKDQNESAMMAVASLVAHSMDSESVERIAKETLTVIHRLFDFQFVYIAMRGGDGLYRYIAQIGLPKEKEASLFKIVYTKDDVFDESFYPSTQLSELTRFYMSESMPYKIDEVETFGRPIMIGQKRKEPNEMIEADYFDVYIRDCNQDIIGYIELSSTRSRILPERTTIAWLELIATLIGIIISKKK